MKGADRYIKVEATTTYLVGPFPENMPLSEAVGQARFFLTEAGNRDDTFAVRHLDIVPPEDDAAFTDSDAWGDPFGTEF